MKDSTHHTTQCSESRATSPSESGTYKDTSQEARQPSSKVKIAVVAAVSLLAGGLAAAWYYRKTVSLLQNPPSGPGDSNFGIFSPDPDAEQNVEIDPEI